MKFSFLLLFMCGGFLTAQNIPLYVGTYTNAECKGIYYYDFNIETGKLTNKKLAIEAVNPSFITFSKNKKFLYAVSESGNESKVLAYSVNSSGLLNLVNEVSSNGNGPCHVQLNKKGSKAVVSNYGGGTISIYNIKKNGSLDNAFQVINHNTSDLKSHAHSAKFLNNNLFVADLGRDFLAQYVKNKDQYLLKENYLLTPKSGPRHFEISKKGKFIYLINELSSTVTVLKKEENSYSEIQNISTLDAGFKDKSYCADIHLSKDEQFLYGSNRGENTIVVYKRNIEDGTLKKIQSISVEGDWPRNFTLAPNGKFLLVANQKSNNISIYSRQQKTGTLTYLYSKSTTSPVCLLF